MNILTCDSGFNIWQGHLEPSSVCCWMAQRSLERVMARNERGSKARTALAWYQGRNQSLRAVSICASYQLIIS